MCIRDRDNVVADILSRNPTDATPEEVNDDVYEYLINHIMIKMDKEVCRIIKDIGKYQLDDIKLKTIINKVNKGSLDKELSEFYKYVSGKLYRRRKNEWKLYLSLIHI